MEGPRWYRGRSHELKARWASTGLSFPFCKTTGFWTGSVVPTSGSAPLSPETLKKYRCELCNSFLLNHGWGLGILSLYKGVISRDSDEKQVWDDPSGPFPLYCSVIP